MQSVFNRSEYMMHVDKNADGHVVDQNAERILREIAYVPLSGRIRSKGSSCMQLFFFFFFFVRKKKMSIRHAYQWSQQMRISVVILNLDMLPRGLMDLKFGRTS